MMASATPQSKSADPVLVVLIVDPDILVRLVLAEYLRNCGYRVIESGNTDEAMAVLGSADIKLDVVLAEIHALGASDGFALAKYIRETHPHIDVILTSGVAQAADKAVNLCEHKVLKQPYHPAEVLRRIQLLRERRRMSPLSPAQ